MRFSLFDENQWISDRERSPAEKSAAGAGAGGGFAALTCVERRGPLCPIASGTAYCVGMRSGSAMALGMHAPYGARSFCAYAQLTVYAARQNFILLMQLFRFAYRSPPVAKALRPWNPTGEAPVPAAALPP